MQFVVITSPNLSRIEKALSSKDGIELRLDLFETLDIAEVASIRDICKKRKVIFTLRSKEQGGGFNATSKKHQQCISECMALKPDYFDIESSMPDAFIRELSSQFPTVNIILSHHDFLYTPRHLHKTLNRMHHEKAYAYKICTTATKIEDSYRMLKFIQTQTSNNQRIIGLCMGEQGKITREEGVAAGNYLNYSILHESDGVAQGLDFA